ncbi:MAG: NADP-dependent malic enzyme [Huintestinicola sp.]
MNYLEESIKMHYKWKGKIEMVSRISADTVRELSLAYTPGVAGPCFEIQKDISKSFELTRRANLVAVVTDGSAVLGLGDIGPEASMPVMEGKCALFKLFGDVDAVPICIRSNDVDDIVNTVKLISGSFGGINLEDISAPRCFEIERRLRNECDIPVFHDDQHGTAVVTLAAAINALKVTGRKMNEVRTVINGAGAAGAAIAKLLAASGFENIIVCDRKGAIYKGRGELDVQKAELADITNHEMKKGSLHDVMCGADMFIGVSSPDCVSEEMVCSMAEAPIVFALANPRPEIMPCAAQRAGAAVIGTGRSDFPNQINNVLAFPGIFRGALDARASEITEKMKTAAAYAIAAMIPDNELSAENIIPSALDRQTSYAVADAVRKAAE